jgi:hypothetical protein
MVRFPFIGLLVTVLLGVIICAGQSAAPKAISGRRKVVLNGLMAGLLVSGQVSAYLAPWTWSGLITWVLVLVPAAIICAWGVWSVTVRIAGRAPQAVIGIGADNSVPVLALHGQKASCKLRCGRLVPSNRVARKREDSRLIRHYSRTITFSCSCAGIMCRSGRSTCCFNVQCQLSGNLYRSFRWPLMAGKCRWRTVPPPPTRHDPDRTLS